MQEELTLIKTGDVYNLMKQGFLKGSSNHSLIDRLNIEEGVIRHKLCLKNCEAIQSGYDFQELSKKIRGLMMVSGTSNGTIDHPNTDKMISLFQKTLELFGDKKFSEEDLIMAILFGSEKFEPNFERVNDKKEFIQSLQQTKWNVEIVKIHGFDDFNDPKPFSVPQLDSQGQITLKRK